MINPNKLTRFCKGTVISNETDIVGRYFVKLHGNQGQVMGYDLPKHIKVGDIVKVRLQWSMTLDKALIAVINKKQKQE